MQCFLAYLCFALLSNSGWGWPFTQHAFLSQLGLKLCLEKFYCRIVHIVCAFSPHLYIQQHQNFLISSSTKLRTFLKRHILFSIIFLYIFEVTFFENCASVFIKICALHALWLETCIALSGLSQPYFYVTCYS